MARWFPGKYRPLPRGWSAPAGCGEAGSGHENNSAAVTNILAKPEKGVIASTPRALVGGQKQVLEGEVEGQATEVVGPYGLKFGPSRIVMTKAGSEKAVRDARPTEEFWQAWRAHKDRLKELGFGCRKDDGTGVWIVSLWDELLSVEQRQASLDASRATDAAIDIPLPEGLELLPYQRGGIAYALQREATLIGDEMGCIDGTAVVHVNRAKKGQTMLLATLYKRWQSWDHSIPTYMRSLAGDELRLNRVKKVLFKGRKPVLRVVLESGKALRLTSDHEVALPEGGWRAAESLRIGDRVLTNGTPACVRCSSTADVITYKYAKFLGYCRQCMYRYCRDDKWHGDGRHIDDDGYVRVSGQWDHPRAQKSGVVFEHILVAESHLGRLLGSGEEVHHINGDTSDNRIENLEIVSRSEHHRRHRKHLHLHGGVGGRGGLVSFLPKQDTVVSAEYDGVADVYDVVMDDPHRNFVANGIVVHNCGKTIQAIGVANVVKPKRVLVVCPASIKLNWRREIEKWQVLDLPVRVIYPKDVLSFKQPGWYVVNYDIIARFGQIKDSAWDLIVVDEAHRMKTRTAQRTVFIFGGTKKNKDGELVEVAPIPAKRKLLLTGTPIVNRPSEAFTLLHYLDPVRWPVYSKYRARYCAGYDQGASNLDELQTRLRETVMVRRLKKDVLTELPAKIRQVVAIEPEDGEVRELVEREVRIYEETQAEIEASQAAVAQAKAEENEEAYKAAVERLRKAQAVAFERISKVRHEVGQAKVPYVLRHLEEVEGKVLVFAHHEDVIDAIVAAQDKGTVVSITGKTAQDKRQGIVDQFQNDPNVTMFVGNIQAAGVGITLTASSHVVFAELDWVPGNVSQAEDRAHRIGQHDSVLVQHVVLDGSLDQRMATMIINKQRVIDLALDTGSKTATKLIVPAVSLVPAEEKVDKVEAVSAAVKELPKIIVDRVPEAGGLTQDQVTAIHEALRLLAGMDTDGARILNGVGFSKYDSDFGRSLASQSKWSPRQAEAAHKMVIRYRRQLGEGLLARINGEVAA